MLYAHELGLVPITTPAYSPESNGLAEAFVGTFNRDYLADAELRDAESVLVLALREARLQDEVFLTLTDVVVDERAHEGVLRIMAFDDAELVAEGRIAPESGWVFGRWRVLEPLTHLGGGSSRGTLTSPPERW